MRVWLGLLGYLACLNLYITFVNTELHADPRSALFGWLSIAIFGVLGSIGIVLADRTGFPSAWDSSIALRERLKLPIVIGTAFGVASAILDRFTGLIALFTSMNPGEPFNAPFPGSVAFYAGGAIVVEVLYRLLAIPFCCGSFPVCFCEGAVRRKSLASAPRWNAPPERVCCGPRRQASSRTWC